MSWQSIAEDVVFQILIAQPLVQDPGRVNFLRMALLGPALLPGCPVEYQEQASKLVDDYTRLQERPGDYVEWNEVTIETHLLLARLGGGESETKEYYA